MEEIKKYLGLAHNAGYLIIGGDKLDNYDKKLYLVLIDREAGKTSQKIANRFRNRGIEVQEISNLQSYVLIDNCKIIGIKNKGISEEIKKYLVKEN